MAPPSIPQAAIKNPRPDVSVGIKDAAMFTALQSCGLTLKEAKQLLQILVIPDLRNEWRPLLRSEPTTAALKIRFPFLIVERKSYATSRAIFEAQN